MPSAEVEVATVMNAIAFPHIHLSIEQAAVTLDHLTVKRNDKPVLRDLSLSFLQGTITAVVGCSGVGKSTLMGALNGLTRPACGSVSIAGAGRLDDPASLREARRGTATIFQDHALIDRLPAIDNVLLGLADMRHPLSPLPWPRSLRLRAAQALDEVGLLKLRDRPRLGNSRAASASVSASPEPWFAGRACCWETSRSRRSIRYWRVSLARSSAAWWCATASLSFWCCIRWGWREPWPIQSLVWLTWAWLLMDPQPGFAPRPRRPVLPPHIKFTRKVNTMFRRLTRRFVLALAAELCCRFAMLRPKAGRKSWWSDCCRANPP